MARIEQIWAPDSISYAYNSPELIVVHYTATDASAYNNALYLSRGGSGNSSAHYFVDGGGTIYQSVPDNRGAWHSGNYECNTRSIGIETVSAGEDFSEAEIAELAWLVQTLMASYGIPAERVIRHYDVADYFDGYTIDPHKNCPAPYVDAGKWAELHARITNGGEITGGFDMAEALFYIKDNHNGYMAGDIVYYNSTSGFRYLSHPDCVSVLNKMGDIAKIESRSGANWAYRAAQCLQPGVRDATFGKRG